MRNLQVWDTLPAELTYISNDFDITPAYDPVNNYLHWDLSNDIYGQPFVLYPGQEVEIRFTVQINTIDITKLPIVNMAWVDYNDPYYCLVCGNGKHPPINSSQSFYPTGRPVVFPNPFDPGSDGVVRWDNIVPNSQIEIYTISGENVITLHTDIHRMSWDGKNRHGQIVSSGVYFFIIRNLSDGSVMKGKMFIVKNN